MSDTKGNAQGNGDDGRRLSRFWMAMLWLTLIVVALFPFPWGW